LCVCLFAFVFVSYQVPKGKPLAVVLTVFGEEEEDGVLPPSLPHPLTHALTHPLTHSLLTPLEEIDTACSVDQV
jgi:hypothetical protein